MASVYVGLLLYPYQQGKLAGVIMDTSIKASLFNVIVNAQPYIILDKLVAVGKTRVSINGT